MIQSGRHLADASIQIGEQAGLRCPPEEQSAETDVGQHCPLPDDPSDERLRLLVSTVESQIIPRLVIAHRATLPSGSPLAAVGPPRARPEEVVNCVRLLLDPGACPIVAFSEELLAGGLSLDALYLEVFAPAARLLGEMWLRDECTFTDVTIALGRLQQSLRRFSAHFRPESIDGEPWRRAFFAAVPGEQHTFGLSMIVQYFLRAGWDASMLPGSAGEELPVLVREEHTSLVGFSMSQEANAPTLRALILKVREGSRNTALRVIVGGVAFVDQPGLVADVGADGMAVDATQAVNLAQHLVL
jgi:methanogenic corrinoid protein MtbC1